VKCCSRTFQEGKSVRNVFCCCLILDLNQSNANKILNSDKRQTKHRHVACRIIIFDNSLNFLSFPRLQVVFLVFRSHILTHLSVCVKQMTTGRNEWTNAARKLIVCREKGCKRLWGEREKLYPLLSHSLLLKSERASV